MITPRTAHDGRDAIIATQSRALRRIARGTAPAGIRAIAAAALAESDRLARHAAPAAPDGLGEQLAAAVAPAAVGDDLRAVMRSRR